MIPKQQQTIKTNIKFFVDLDNESRLYGFVTKVKGSWRGCRDTEKLKKIVFPDHAIEKDIIPNVLYSCSLIPIKSENGFIAKTAKLLKFKASIASHYRDDKKIYNVIVKFGNKVIIYNPASKESRQRNITKIADELRNRVDLLDAHAVAEDFVNNACIVKRLYNQRNQKCSQTK